MLAPKKDFLHSEGYDTIYENNREISRLLAENEDIIRKYLNEQGLNNQPVDNIHLGYNKVGEMEGLNPDKNGRKKELTDAISIPQGYVRTLDTIIADYGFDKIIKDEVQCKNCASMIMSMDAKEFFLNRFYIWGYLETINYKDMIQNVASIIEALLYFGLLEARQNPAISDVDAQSQTVVNDCTISLFFYERINRKVNFAGLIYFFEHMKPNLLNLTSDDYRVIGELRDKRNGIHLQKNTERFYDESIYNRRFYEESVEVLRKVSTSLAELLS